MMDYLDEPMRKVFRSIHFNPKYAATSKSTPAEKHRKHIKDDIDGLVKKFKHNHPENSWAESYKIVRAAHIQYMGELFHGVEKTFTVDGTEFVSKQTIPEGHKFLNCYDRACYDRNGETQSLPAFRQHTFEKKKENSEECETLIKWYHHSSPIPYEEKDFKKRMDATIKNLQQVPLSEGETLAEIRLLSPMKGIGSHIAGKYFTTLNDYDQLLETAIAAELSGRDIILFNFGVNQGRYYADELQTLLNTRAMTKLFSKVLFTLAFAEKPIKNEPLIKSGFDEETTKKYFLASLKQDNESQWNIWQEQLRLFQQEGPLFPKQKEIYDCTIRVINLLLNNRWEKPEYNYEIQAALVKLNYLLGHTVATGCNDAKDRDGRLAITVEAHEIAEQKEASEIPEKKIKTSRKELEAIEKTVYENSTPRFVAPLISTPYLEPEVLNIGGKLDGNDHLGNERGDSGILKRLHPPKLLKKYERMDNPTAWDRLKVCVKKGMASVVTSFWGLLFVLGISVSSTAAANSMNFLDGVASATNLPVTSILDDSAPARREEPSVPESRARENDIVATDEKKEQKKRANSFHYSNAEAIGRGDLYRRNSTGSASPPRTPVSTQFEHDSDRLSSDLSRFRF